MPNRDGVNILYAIGDPASCSLSALFSALVSIPYTILND